MIFLESFDDALIGSLKLSFIHLYHLPVVGHEAIHLAFAVSRLSVDSGRAALANQGLQDFGESRIFF